MKIAILVPTFWAYSGPDRVAEQQATDLARQGDEVTIFTLSAKMAPPPGVKMHMLGMPKRPFLQRVYRLLFPLDIVKAMRWVPKLRGYDVVYCHQYPMTWLGYMAKRRYGTRYIYYDHGITPAETFSRLSERIYMRLFSHPANWTIRRADGAISVSRYLQHELAQTTGVRSEVVYNTIDTKRFHPGIDPDRIREKHNLGDSPVILYVGRLSPHKGVHLLLDAFELVSEDFPNAKLLVVGRHTFGDYSRKLKQRSNGSVIYAEDVADEDLPRYYSVCDVYATASQWEGFNLPLAEAQACGKPVVAFDIGPHAEVIARESAGVLVPEGEIAAFAEALIRFLPR